MNGFINIIFDVKYKNPNMPFSIFILWYINFYPNVCPGLIRDIIHGIYLGIMYQNEKVKPNFEAFFQDKNLSYFWILCNKQILARIWSRKCSLALTCCCLATTSFFFVGRPHFSQSAFIHKFFCIFMLYALFVCLNDFWLRSYRIVFWLLDNYIDQGIR